MPSNAATNVKFGFWIAAGFWLFALVAGVVLMLCLRALSDT
jgi:hypothetical protein